MKKIGLSEAKLKKKLLVNFVKSTNGMDYTFLKT